MEELSPVQIFAVTLLPVLFAITLHEVAHGWVARLLGDDTAARLGRLSANPLHHIDPLGTVIVPSILYFMGGFIFGWAKPVPVDWRRLRKPRRDMALVAIAGPGANLLMALFWVLIIRLAVALHYDYVSIPLVLMGQAGVGINLMLMLLNLLPILPLDGGRVAAGLLPQPMAYQFSKIEPYGFFILMALIATGALGKILGLPLGIAEQLFFGLAGMGGK